jgi:hypothetical protein
MDKIIKSYKGFNKDMTCKGFQYEEGKEYETDNVNCCNSGFHACEHPLDCFRYYSPNESVFHEVEQSGELSYSGGDSKVASGKIKIGTSLSIADIVQAAIEYTTERSNKENDSTGYKGASSATGTCGASSATGYKGASSSGNKDSVAVAWGYKSKARGVLGSYLVLADWDGNKNRFNKPSEWTLKCAKMVRVDGDTIKENVWYTMRNGEIVEADDSEY